MSLLNPVAFNGQSGNVQISGQTLSVREWKVTLEVDSINVTSTNAGGYRQFIPGPAGFNGEFKINADVSSFAPGPTTYFNPAGNPGTVATCYQTPFQFIFTLGCTTHQIQGNGYITRTEINNPASEDVTISYQFVGTGEFFLYS